jgi:hypothetical protein
MKERWSDGRAVRQGVTTPSLLHSSFLPRNELIPSDFGQFTADLQAKFMNG